MTQRRVLYIHPLRWFLWLTRDHYAHCVSLLCFTVETRIL